MSTVKANNVQVGQSGTATNNFTLYQPSTPDGTVRLAVGNSGATSADVLTANSSGNVGIGTSSPANIGAGYPHLEVNGSTTGVISVSAGGVRGLSLSADNSAANIQARVSGQPLLLFTNGGAGATERMRIDSSGNVGVGVTPSAWNTVTPIQVKNASFAGYSTTNAYMLQNAYYASGGWKYISNGAAARFEINGSSYEWSGAASGTAGNAITFTPFLTIDKDKTLALQGATSATGTGIAFPATQSASSDANTLDDYEEGTWTPTIIGTTTAGAGTYVTQDGTYTKIGRVVTVSGNVEWSAHTGTGNMRISNLPFTTASGGAGNSSVTFGIVNNLALTAGNILAGVTAGGSVAIALRQYPTGGGAESFVPVDTAAQLLFSVSYVV